MPSPFQTALMAFIEAERNYDRVVHDDNASQYDVDEMEEQLAQAGDVLESELRKMMREEGCWGEPTQATVIGQLDHRYLLDGRGRSSG